MKKLFIVANWKSNSIQFPDWIEGFKNYDLGFKNVSKEIVICPPFTQLSILKSYLMNLPAGGAGHKLSFKIGAQNISPFEKGAYTGEVNGEQIKEFADYVIIGHSERRKNFSENDEVINNKLEQAINNNLIPVLCVSDLFQIQNSKFKIQNYNSKFKINDREIIIAYEPIFAIGTGKPDSPENADEIAGKIKDELNGISVLYGGSVTSGNVNNFTKMPNIDGVLVGKASLDPLEFGKIIQHA